MLERELGELDRALQEVTDMVSDERIHLDEVRHAGSFDPRLSLTITMSFHVAWIQINADGLVAVVERKAQGETLGAEDVAEVQVSATGFG